MSIQNQDDTIDISKIPQQLKSFLNNIILLLFKGFYFLRKNIFSLLLILVIGFILGYLIDEYRKRYYQQIIVSPNFGSTEYLYEKINFLNSKVKEQDTIILKEIGIQNPKNIREISITPIGEVFKYIENKPENFELIKLMAENSKIEDILKDKNLTRNFKFHSIFIKSKKTNYKNTVQPILTYLNSSKYFNTLQKQRIQSINTQIRENDSIISQINGILNAFAENSESNTKSKSLVFYNENTQINEIIRTKEELIEQNENHKAQLLNLDKIIKPISYSLNVLEKEKFYTEKLKFLFPISLVFLFLLIKSTTQYYKKHKDRIES
ncbi:MAG: hypothetical protein H6604_04365 [Flavobacteriales bacterium]|nr:hypothetical protein [Flavobacteriales bacterium]